MANPLAGDLLPPHRSRASGGIGEAAIWESRLGNERDLRIAI
jgi:hypothetical protein